jgi:hypothetical protein
MPRRKKPLDNKKGWHWYANMGLNIFVALSMVLGTLVLFTGNSLTQPRGIVLPTDIPGSDLPGLPPTLAPTVGAPISTIVPAATPAATPTR